MKKTAQRAAAPDTLRNSLFWQSGLCSKSQQALPGVQRHFIWAIAETWFGWRASGTSQNRSQTACDLSVKEQDY